MQYACLVYFLSGPQKAILKSSFKNPERKEGKMAADLVRMTEAAFLFLPQGTESGLGLEKQNEQQRVCSDATTFSILPMSHVQTYILLFSFFLEAQI